jgi:glutaredoxin
MKIFIRLFFKTLRVILGPVILLKEIITRPKGQTRPQAAQEKVDQQCQSLVLYQYKTCPFCLKVRQEMHRLSLPIERRDAQYDEKDRAALLQGSGLTKVPCLKITDRGGKVKWLKDSGAIIAYLRGRFASS